MIKLEREKIVPERWDHQQGLGGFCSTCNRRTCPPAPPWRFFPFSSVLKDTLWCHHHSLFFNIRLPR